MDKTEAGEEEILTPEQVAGYLKLHLKTVYKLAATGEIPGSRVGRCWRFRRSAVREFLRRPHVPREKRDPVADLNATAPDDDI